MVVLLRHQPEPFIHAVMVDGQTGAREEWIERHWDFDAEGFP